jgi:murein L,D-transpeptidase YcbB/YkuD
MIVGGNACAYSEHAGDAVRGVDASTATTQDAIRLLMSSPDAAKANPSVLETQLETFYAARDFEPVWTGSDDALQRAKSIKAVLEKADLQGLRSTDYVSALKRWKSEPRSGRDAAAYDVTLTRALFAYAIDVHVGRVNAHDVYKDVNLPDEGFDVATVLAKALRRDASDRFLADLPPIHPGYHYLASALARYELVASKGGWPIVAAPEGGTRAGKHSDKSVLRKRLAFEDPALAALRNPSPQDVRAAVLRFQKRNGLAESGKLDPATLKALNVSAAYRAKEIMANMERWRWLPRELEHRYIEVDVPDQSLKYIEDGKVLLYSRVVVGKQTSPTPILRTDVMAVVANPPWDVPSDIAAKKILPQLRERPDYLVARNMVLAGGPQDDPHGVTVDWKHVKGALPYQIQQSPGPDNMLGTLMLDMPNPFDVYLHDTVNKNLFQLDKRERSNGCVRVQEISELASLALSGSTTGAQDDLSNAIASGETKRLTLDRPMAVYMLYWTAIAWPDGTVSFLPDPYHRDEPLMAKLAGGRARS